MHTQRCNKDFDFPATGMAQIAAYVSKTPSTRFDNILRLSACSHHFDKRKPNRIRQFNKEPNMDNLTYRIEDVDIHVPSLKQNLEEKGIPVSIKTVPRKQDEIILFSLPIGRHQCRWMFRCSTKGRSISCSGGVTKTFFGHNVWVFKKEFEQLTAIIEIISTDLANIGGITLPSSMDAITVERVELTRHHVLNESVSKRQAIDRLSTMFMTLFPDRHFRNGANLDQAGTTGIGLNKSTRVCRVYDPAFKLKEKPAHVPDAVWATFGEECGQHLRVELMFPKRELESAHLSKVAAWANVTSLEGLVAKRYKDYGLSVKFNTDVLPPSQIISTNPAFVEAARYFFTNGERGAPIDSRSGTSNRFKQYMAAKGYCTDVAFSRHIHLAHDLHRILEPQLAAELPNDLRSHRKLFNYWWLGTDS